MVHRIRRTVRYERTLIIFATPSITSSNVAQVAKHLLSLDSHRDRAAVVALNGKWGLGDDPVDETPEIAIGPYDPTGDYGALKITTEMWVDEQNWRSLGTPGQVLDTLSRVSNDDLDVEIRGDPSQPVGLGLFVKSNVQSSLRIVMQGEVAHVCRIFHSPGEYDVVVGV